MLYDKRWDKPEIKADPFSLESLVAWLEKQPANRKYSWPDIHGCLSCTYLEEAHGIMNPASQLHPMGHGSTMLDAVFPNHDTYFAVAGETPWTMGAALTRAREALARR